MGCVALDVAVVAILASRFPRRLSSVFPLLSALRLGSAHSLLGIAVTVLIAATTKIKRIVKRNILLDRKTLSTERLLVALLRWCTARGLLGVTLVRTVLLSVVVILHRPLLHLSPLLLFFLAALLLWLAAICRRLF